MAKDNRPTFLGGRVQVLTGDITLQETDAIVNAANPGLMGGAGVDGAIHKRGGPQILEECREIRRTLFPNGLPTGAAVITTGGLLKARYVIHTVGPVYGTHGGYEPELLASCYRSSLDLVASHGLASVSFPAISTGAYGYPKSEASCISSRAIKQFLDHDEAVSEVRLVFFSRPDTELFLASQCFEDSYRAGVECNG